jgi:hypothetical protein
VSVDGNAVTIVNPGARCFAHVAPEPVDVETAVLELPLPVATEEEDVFVEDVPGDDGEDEQPAAAAIARGATANESERTCGVSVFFMSSPRNEWRVATHG